MFGDRLPSLLLSFILHLAVAVLVLWWPSSPPVQIDPSRGVLVSGFVTLGKAGKAVSDGKQEIPQSQRGEGQSQPAPEVRPEVKPEVRPDPRPEAKPEIQPAVTPEVKPEVKPETRPAPDPDAVPIPKDPEKKPEPKPEEKKPEPPKPEEKKPEPKPEEKKPTPKPEEKKPEPKKEDKKPEPPKKKDDLSSALADLGKQVGGDARGTTGRQTPGRGKGQDLSNALADLGKQVSGGGDDTEGRGSGGSGGTGIGVRGEYLDVVHSRVKSNWSWPGRADRRVFSTLVNIQISPSGQITNARLLRSSGNAPYDSSVMRALNLTRQLEPPPNQALMDINIEFAF